MRYKKIMAALLTASMLSVPFFARAAHFEDTRGHWAETVIDSLADSGVVHGVSDTEFNPDGTVTRAEFLKMALGAVGIDDVTYREGECLDVETSDWYGGCVQSALDKGLIPENMIDGFDIIIEEGANASKAVYSGRFNGMEPIKREEMAYITQSVYQYSLKEGGLEKLEVPADLFFSDVSAISVWAFDGVRHAYANGFIAGMPDGTFSPQSSATRAQAAVIIDKLMNK